MILGQKVEVFYVLCFLKIDREKVFPNVLDKKGSFEDFKKKLFMKSAKLEFFQRG